MLKCKFLKQRVSDFYVIILLFHSFDKILSGIFIALALRLDVSREKQPQYFKSSFLGYTIGLALSIFVINWFQAAHLLEFDESKIANSSQKESDPKSSKKSGINLHTITFWS
ncbi:hypothetical protein HN51_017032 [Arachis hypogaea]